MGRCRLWNISWLRYQMFSFVLIFLGTQRILGYGRPWRTASSKKREKKALFLGCVWRGLRIGTAFARHCDVIVLQMRPFEGCSPRNGTQPRRGAKKKPYVRLTNKRKTTEKGKIMQRSWKTNILIRELLHLEDTCVGEHRLCSSVLQQLRIYTSAAEKLSTQDQIKWRENFPTGTNKVSTLTKK